LPLRSLFGVARNASLAADVLSGDRDINLSLSPSESHTFSSLSLRERARVRVPVQEIEQRTPDRECH
jgi:hypothetical protein